MLLSHKLTALYLLLLMPLVSTGAPKTPPESTLKLFYEHINSQQCESAILLRPSYSLDRCQKISEVIIHETNTVFNNGSDSVILISIDIYTKNAKSYFSGYVRLQNTQSKWHIIGPYKSQQNYTLAEYINDYAPSNDEASSNIQKDITTPVITPPEHEEQVVNPTLDKYLSGEQEVAGNYTRLLNDLRTQLIPLTKQQILLIDRSRSSIYLYDQNNLLQGFFPILSSLESNQVPNGVYQIAASQVAEDNENSPVHLNHLHTFPQEDNNTDSIYYLRSLLDSDTEHSLLLSPIDLGKLRTLVSTDLIAYMGN